MEVAGLAVGVAGLAGLFSACSSAFLLVQKGRSFGKDYKILETKFNNQELRLRAWGRACGLIDGTQYDVRLDEPELHQQLEATLECIKLLLGDAKELKDRYGLRPCEGRFEGSRSDSIAIGSYPTGARPVNFLERRGSLKELLFRRTRSQRSRPNSASAIGTALWIIEDREKFSELVRHLKDFIDDLEDLTRATDVPPRQLIFVEYEIESIDDVDELEYMEMARQGDDDAVSDAASARLEQLSQGTASIRASMETGRTGSFITLESYFTARTQSSVSRTNSLANSASSGPILAAQTGQQGRSPAMVSIGSSTVRPGDEGEILPCYKCVVVGEASARKTELLSKFKFGNSPPRYMPVVFEEYVITCGIFGRQVNLALWDTSGTEGYDNFRTATFANADVFIICFPLGVSQDRNQVRERWLPELQRNCPGAGYVLTGIEPGSAHETSPDDLVRGKNFAREIGAWGYVQCNIETGAGVNDVFEAVTRAVIPADWARSGSRLSRGWTLPWRNRHPELRAIEETWEGTAE